MNWNRKAAFILLICAVAALGGLLFGFDTAVISGAIPYIKDYFGLDEYGLGWAVSSILIGCVLGAAFAGRVADRYGRRTVLVACAIAFALSGIGAGTAHHISEFIIFRLIGGLGVGAAAMVSPMYIAEVAPAAWRGRLVALYQLAIVTGILLAYYSNYRLADLGLNNWRWMFASQIAPSLLFWLMLLFVPETPRWLMLKQRRQEAIRVLEKITGREEAMRELDQMERSLLEEGRVSGTGRVGIDVLFRTPYSRIILIGIAVAVFQQVTGINAILYYAPVIFKETGMASADSLLQTISIGAVNVASTLIAILLVDRLGRKKLLRAGSALMFLSLLTLAICFRYKYFGGYIVLASMLVYVGSFGCTLGAVTWIYLSEIFPNRIRGLALSVATLALWMADFLVTYAFPILTKKTGVTGALVVYALFCAGSFFFTMGKIPETKGRSLEEIETLFIK